MTPLTAVALEKLQLVIILDAALNVDQTLVQSIGEQLMLKCCEQKQRIKLFGSVVDNVLLRMMR